MKFVSAPPGTNPMDTPELVKRQRVQTWRVILIVLGCLLGLGLLCGLPIYLISRPQQAAQAKGPTATSTLAMTPSASPTLPLVMTMTLSPIPTRSATPGAGAPTLAPITATPIVREVTRVVSGGSYPVPVVTVQVITVHVPIEQTVIVTTTPEPTSTQAPTQTPWIIYQTQIVEVTREVTPTETASPTPTETATETPATQME